MLEQASRGITVDPSRVKFIEQDCSKAQEIDGGGFDLAFGAWFLNYAATREELVEMFRLIAMNLKEGGRFVGITCPPTADPAAFVQAERDLRLAPQGSGGLLCSINYEVKDGVYFHVFADTEAGEVNFDCWHLLKRVYEEAAREGGMNGVLEWSATEVTDEFIRTREGGASVEELESYRKVPHYGMLVVGK